MAPRRIGVKGTADFGYERLRGAHEPAVTPAQDRELLRALPAVGERRVALRVSPAAERMLRHGHPWLYADAIRRQSHEGAPGDLAVIFDGRNRFLAIGLYDPASPIRVRVLQHQAPAPITRQWFQHRLDAAARLRAPLASADTTGYRLVHGENDSLPGLVVDRYDETLVLKLYTPAWVPHLREVVAALQGVAPARRGILRLSRATRQQTGALHGLTDGLILWGASLCGPVLFQEHGLHFEANLLEGQKTGCFLDQRENRARVRPLSAGCAVLDVFAYTGGFSVYAAAGGARTVTSLDLSRPALLAAQRNMALNRRHRTVAGVSHEVLAGDAFEALAQLRRARRRFDLVILDPPAFAKAKEEAADAVAAYRTLTRLGLGVLRPGGLLVSACCSSQVPAETFFATIHRAAAAAGRPLRELERTGQPLDHPVTFKEGAYLKALFAIAQESVRLPN